MAAPVGNNFRTVLLLLPTKKEMYPLSTAAFGQAQSSRGQIRENYKEALILDGDGKVRRLDDIEVIGPLGHTFGRRLLSRLTDAWQIKTRLSDPLNYSLEEIKHLLIECSASDVVRDTMAMNHSEFEEFVAAIRSASGVGELLMALQLPSPEDALDVL